MAILYELLRPLVRFAVETYFVDIEVLGAENLPASGPLILAANHPNSIMDTFVLGAQVDRPIAYLARSGLFRNPVIAKIFDAAGVIPVYRREDGETSDPDANRDAFSAAHEVLRRGGAIGIFPEGRNSPERHVRELKTGAARIALGAEADCDFGLGVQVVPIGLNFEDRDRFLTRVLVRIGQPIPCADYRSAYAEDAREAVVSLTQTLQDAIREATVHIHDEVHADLVQDLHDIYGATLLEEHLGRMPDVRGLDEKMLRRLTARSYEYESLEDRFAVKQWIADAVKHFEVHDPLLLHRIARDVDRYKTSLEQLDLPTRFDEVAPDRLSMRKEVFRFASYAIVFAPIAIWGFVHHIAPVRLASRLSRGASDEAIRAVRMLLFGGLFCSIAYAIYGAWAWSATGGAPIKVALYLFSLPIAWFWFLRYRRRLAIGQDRIRLRRLFLTQRRWLHLLGVQRERLIRRLDRARERYREAVSTMNDN